MSKSILKYAPLLALLAAPLAVGAAAGTSGEAKPKAAIEASAQTTGPEALPAEELRGQTVYGADEAEIGQIADVRADEDGEMAAIVQKVDATTGEVTTTTIPLADITLTADGKLKAAPVG